jgi:thiol-disulfide isomerase/thioredoxin
MNIMYKKIFSISGFIFLLTITLTIYFFNKYRIPPKIYFPSINVINDKNEITRFSLNSGKMTVVSFYASWCVDCKTEFPKMQSAKSSDFSELDFVAITDEGFALMNRFKENHKYPFIFYSLVEPFENYGIHAIPTTYILNPKNEIIYSKVGHINWKDEKFIMEIKKQSKILE